MTARWLRWDNSNGDECGISAVPGIQAIFRESMRTHERLSLLENVIGEEGASVASLNK